MDSNSAVLDCMTVVLVLHCSLWTPKGFWFKWQFNRFPFWSPELNQLYICRLQSKTVELESKDHHISNLSSLPVGKHYEGPNPAALSEEWGDFPVLNPHHCHLRQMIISKLPDFLGWSSMYLSSPAKLHQYLENWKKKISGHISVSGKVLSWSVHLTSFVFSVNGFTRCGWSPWFYF